MLWVTLLSDMDYFFYNFTACFIPYLIVNDYKQLLHTKKYY